MNRAINQNRIAKSFPEYGQPYARFYFRKLYYYVRTVRFESAEKKYYIIIFFPPSTAASPISRKVPFRKKGASSTGFINALLV
jgi:hypothetical protein